MQIKKYKLILGTIAIVILTAVSTFIFSASLLRPSFFKEGIIAYINKYLIKKEIKPDFGKIEMVKEYIDENYLGEYKEEEVLDTTLKAMTNALGDPYTAYLNKEEMTELLEDTLGFYNGIGIVVTYDTKEELPLVVSAIKDTPAHKAGIQSGDKILKVNKQELKGETLQEVVKIIKGKNKLTENESNNLEIVIKRNIDGIDKEITFNIERQQINIKTVKSETIENIGYIMITAFDEQTSKDFKEQYEQLISQNIKGIIIDLRDNPGGTVKASTEIADLLIPEGLIVYTKNKIGTIKEWNSDKVECNLPIAVLVNNGTASASEILTGALKDTKKATIIGETTHGKGVVQSIIDLKDGTALKITSAEYFTPLGNKIHKIGIKPDIEIKLPEEYTSTLQKIDMKEDTQLQKALEILK